MPFHLARTRSVPALLADLRRLWKSERIRHIACVFDAQLSGDSALALQACSAHGLPAFRHPQGSAADVLVSLTVQAVAMGHEPVLVSNDVCFESLCSHRAVQLLRISGKGKNLRLDYLDHEQLPPQAARVAPQLGIAFRLEEVTPGGCVRLADFYRSAGMQKELEQLQGLFGEPQSVMQLWS